MYVKDETSKRVWLTWETQRRNPELAGAFGCKFKSFDYSETSAIVRYFLSSVFTLLSLARERPRIIFAQYPSLVLNLLLSLLRQIFPFVYVMDAHNVFFEDLSNSGWKGRLARFCAPKADFILVSNKLLSQKLLEKGLCSLVLPDRIPCIKCPTSLEAKTPSQCKVTLISTFAADEPIEEFIKGTLKTNVDFKLFITGHRRKAKDLLRYESDRICFTDFLSQVDYDKLISNSTLLIDLTTRQDCLVCGAYEGLAVGVPVILSDTLALRSTFKDGMLFAKNTAQSYADILEEFFSQPLFYKKRVQVAKEQFEKYWNEQFKNCNRHIFNF